MEKKQFFTLINKNFGFLKKALIIFPFFLKKNVFFGKKIFFEKKFHKFFMGGKVFGILKKKIRKKHFFSKKRKIVFFKKTKFLLIRVKTFFLQKNIIIVHDKVSTKLSCFKNRVFRFSPTDTIGLRTSPTVQFKLNNFTIYARTWNLRVERERNVLYQYSKACPLGQGRFIKIADLASVIRGWDFFFEGALGYTYPSFGRLSRPYRLSYQGDFAVKIACVLCVRTCKFIEISITFKGWLWKEKSKNENI